MNLDLILIWQKIMAFLKLEKDYYPKNLAIEKTKEYQLLQLETANTSYYILFILNDQQTRKFL